MAPGRNIKTNAPTISDKFNSLEPIVVPSTSRGWQPNSDEV